MSEVGSRRSPSGCGDAIWPTGVESNHYEEEASLACDYESTLLV